MSKITQSEPCHDEPEPVKPPPKPIKAQSEAAAFRKFEKLLRKFLKFAPKFLKAKLGERPAFPAINVPNSGCMITASQTSTTAMNVNISTNRPDLSHFVDLLDGDGAASLPGSPYEILPAAFTKNTATVNETIPAIADAGPTTLMLQCRAPASLAGNVHRILFDISDPAPKVKLSAVDKGGADLPQGKYDLATTAGLDVVVVTAEVTSDPASGPFTYTWAVTQDGVPDPDVKVTLPDTKMSLPAFDLTVLSVLTIGVQVEDAHGLKSNPPLLVYILV